MESEAGDTCGEGGEEPEDSRGISDPVTIIVRIQSNN
jgi:hypothetical protein